jgi:hypothetical protein
MKIQAIGALAIAVALVSSGCSKTYTEIEVRDPGRVAVGLWDQRGVVTALPADGSQRVVALPIPGVVAIRQGRVIALGWEAQAPVTLVDERGIFPRLPPAPGIELRDRTLWAAYNVTPNRVVPQHVHPDDAVPVVLSTDLSNVVDAREIREVRHWPGYVCLAAGLVLALAGSATLANERDSGTGYLYVAGSVPLLIYSLVNLTSSNEIKPFNMPGAVPR